MERGKVVEMVPHSEALWRHKGTGPMISNTTAVAQAGDLRAQNTAPCQPCVVLQIIFQNVPQGAPTLSSPSWAPLDTVYISSSTATPPSVRPSVRPSVCHPGRHVPLRPVNHNKQALAAVGPDPGVRRS
ncbi:hypothetical protein SKAU_G00039690 [Synaphobranchus kaupii]|uniref:Uncharacterized protein n=1 Tax=Synaphobranchus kaupii TaxID=118154 RepID=A0A9Q1GF77_SYNKA|nr:hypothetical protein SKAU_G00039690 [Synaphobranchus kaupii]